MESETAPAPRGSSAVSPCIERLSDARPVRLRGRRRATGDRPTASTAAKRLVFVAPVGVRDQGHGGMPLWHSPPAQVAGGVHA